jgi:ectoine hydroxylase-related dioxygenase (phytanoyl-CoA dioxygenase family)
MWHLDYPAEGPGGPAPAMRVFVFLEPVRPHGGGTLYVAGSHRLIMNLAAGAPRPVPSAKMRERLKAADPWFTRLWATPGDEVRGLLGETAQVRGVDVAVEEMTGEAGDLILMHPLMLHGLSHNALDRPRMMLVESLARREAG